MTQEEQNINKGKQHAGKRYNGKYRGKVILNVDPLGKGRIHALVPSVTALLPTTWVEPASPFAGMSVGLFVVPPINANVWIEFIEGDPSHPIYTGMYWDEKDLALIPPRSKPLIKPGQFQIRTTAATITMEDIPMPSIKIETMDGLKIIVNSAGIQAGVGPPTVDTIAYGITIDKAGNIIIKGNTVSMIGNAITITSSGVTAIK